MLVGEGVRSGKMPTHTGDTVPGMPLLSFHVQQVRLHQQRTLKLPSARVPLADVWQQCAARLVALADDAAVPAAPPPEPTAPATANVLPPPPATPPAGYLLVKTLTDQNQGMIERLLVDMPARRQGIGTALVRAARHWARAQGLGALVAHAPLRNVPGITFYQHLGFRICGVIEHFYITNEDAMLLVRSV